MTIKPRSAPRRPRRNKEPAAGTGPVRPRQNASTQQSDDDATDRIVTPGQGAFPHSPRLSDEWPDEE